MSSVQKVVVTGGAGFIGSHLVDALLADGHEVHVVDNFASGSSDNLAHAASEPRLFVHEADINDQTALLPVMNKAKSVFHLAALADIVPSIERPLDYARANVSGTLSVLEAARQAGVARFLYAASSSCYGANPVYPTPETAPCVPEYPYALTKSLGEQAVLHWHRVYGLPVVALRLFNVYGPRARSNGSYGAMFGVFLAQKLAGKPFTVVGDGTQSRDFTFVTDVVEAFVRAEKRAQDSASTRGVAGEVFNVGTETPVSVNRIVQLLGGPTVSVPKRPGEPERTQADASKIRTALGWQARTSIERGVAILLDRINDWRAAPVWTPESISDATRSWFACLEGTRDEPAPSADPQGGVHAKVGVVS